GSRVVNLGISGATTAQAATQELPVALDAAPTTTVIWLGVNDITQNVTLANFSRDLARILGALHGQPGGRVFVGNLPDLKQLGAFRGRNTAQLDATVKAWNDAIASACSESGATLVDIFSAWNAQGDRGNLISGDGLHPNTAGYQRIADLFWQAMQAAG
ncbi:MAG: SGNH/GDSL hydrolase family protein, partial [Dehalococcoidia bacterium]